MAKQKQKFTKKTILSMVKGKTVDQVIENLKALSTSGYGSCTIEMTTKLSSGPGYFRSYTSKQRCNILIPIEVE